MFRKRIQTACVMLGLLAVVGLSGCCCTQHCDTCCSCGPCCPCDPCPAMMDAEEGAAEGTEAPAPADDEAAPPTPPEAGAYDPAPSPPQEVPAVDAAEQTLPLPRRVFRSVSRIFKSERIFRTDDVPPLPLEN